MIFLLSAWFFPTFITALSRDWPKTTSYQRPSLELSPSPTRLAKLSDNKPLRGLVGKLQQRVLGVSTCGYQDRKSSLPVICSANAICVTNAPNNVLACCNQDNANDCVIKTSCVPFSLVDTVCTDIACRANDFIAVCTNPAATNCISDLYIFGSTTRSWVFCGSRTTTQWTFYNTYLGFTGTPFQISSTNNLVYASTATSTTESSSTNQATSSATHSSSRTTTPGPVHSVPDSNNNSNTPVKAIAGGTVGGVAILAICITIIVWLCLRHRRASKREANYSTNGNTGYLRDPLSMGHIHPAFHQHVSTSGTSNAIEIPASSSPPRYSDVAELDENAAGFNSGTSGTLVSQQGSSTPERPIEADSTPVLQDGRRTTYEMPNQPL